MEEVEAGVEEEWNNRVVGMMTAGNMDDIGLRFGRVDWSSCHVVYNGRLLQMKT